MRTNDIKALHDKSVGELQVMIQELAKQLAQSRLQKKAGKLKNTHLALVSDDIARVKTVLKEKELLALITASVEEKTEEKAEEK
jgi:ribosomal protein L29